jgi:hypothetical protein
MRVPSDLKLSSVTRDYNEKFHRNIRADAFERHHVSLHCFATKSDTSQVHRTFEFVVIADGTFHANFLLE